MSTSDSGPRLFHKEELDYDSSGSSDFLGAGAFGEVFRCRLRPSGRVAALKVLNTPRLKESELSEFNEEVSFLHQLAACPYIIRLLGLCMDPGHYAIVMEFIENGDLEDLLQNSKKRDKHPVIRQWTCRIGMGLDIANGMDFLHKQEPAIIHRDLKSANVLVDGNYRCKIIDFGLATTRRISKRSKRDSCKYNPLGTLAFTAPEILKGDVSPDKTKKIDVYSFSIVLWQLKEMRKPYEDEVHPDVVHANVVAGRRPQPLSDDDCPEGLKDLITRCWHPQPDVRLSFAESIRLLEWILNSIACEPPVSAVSTESRCQSSKKYGKRGYSSDQQERNSMARSLRHFDYDETPYLELDFHNTFIGNGRPNSTSEESLFTVELEKLSPGEVVQLYSDCKGSGFTMVLKPYLIDLLRRGETFQTVVGMFAGARKLENRLEASLEITLPRLLLDVTPKDIFVSLLEVTPKSVHGRLVSLYTSVHCAIPLVYTLRPSVQETKTVTNFHALHDVLALPSYPLVVSCGTDDAVGKGKSDLTEKLVGQLQSSSLSRDSFDIKTAVGNGGPTHSPSIDLALEVKADLEGGLNFADVHGFTMEREFCNALTTLCSVAALVLIHVTITDFDDGGRPDKGLTSLLMECCSLNFSDAELVFLVRDVPSSAVVKDELLLSVKGNLAKLLPNRVADIVAVENLHACRTDAEKRKALVAIGDNIIPVFSKLKKKLPCFEGISKHLSSTLTSGPMPYNRQLTDLKDGFSELGTRIFEILDRSKSPDGRLADKVFPLTAVCTDIARIRQREEELCEHTESLSKQIYSELFSLAQKLRQLKNRKVTCQVSEAVQLFVSLVKYKKYDNLSEFQQYLEKWKSQQLKSLLPKRMQLLGQLRSVGPTSRGTAQSEQTDEGQDSLKRRLEEVSVQIDQLDVSLDSFWNELMELCDLHENDMVDCDRLRKSFDLDPAIAKHVYTQCVLEGYPMQLLHGNPLRMTSRTFLKDVLANLDVHSKIDLVKVVSVVGAPNSAKSSLLNYLFGCRFATRAGGCTKGLSATYVTDSDGRRLLILDTGSALSLEGDGRVIDHQIAIMAMTCSDVVIVNHKGEISAQMKKLLEIRLSAKDYVTSLPELVFALRDQKDRHRRAFRKARIDLQKARAEANASRTGYQERLNIESIFLLPNAFSESAIREGCTITCRSPAFSKETFPMRKFLLDLAQKPHHVSYLGIRIDWYTHAGIVWDTLSKYWLTKPRSSYEALCSLRLEMEMSDVAMVFAKDKVNSDSGLSGNASRAAKKYTKQLHTAGDQQRVEECYTQCKTELDSLMEQYQGEVIHLDDGTNIRRYGDDMKRRSRDKQTTILTCVYELHLSSWQKQVRVVSDHIDREAIDRHFVSQIDTLLKIMPNAEPKELFKRLWTEYESKCKDRLEERIRSRSEIEQTVSDIFDTVATRQKCDIDLLSFVSSSVTERYRVRRLEDDNNKRWCRRYMEINPVYLNEQGPGTYTTPRDPRIDWKCPSHDEVLRDVVPEIKRRVQTLKHKVSDCLISNNGKLDTNVVTDILLAASDMAAKICTKYLPSLKMKLRFDRAVFANDLLVLLHQVTVQAVYTAEKTVEETHYSELLEELKKKRQTKELEFLAVVDENVRDVDCAQMFADRYNDMLQTWMESKVIEFTSQARDQVLRALPDPEKAVEIAYKTSFEEGNYDDVLEYCLDVHAYHKKLFSQTFDKHMQAAIDQSKVVLRDDVLAVYQMLEEFADQWQRLLCGSQVNSTETTHLYEFKEHLQQRASELRQDPAVLTRRMVVVANFPNIANFCIARIDVFSQSFRQNVREYLSKAIATLTDLVSERAKQERYELWVEVRGCTATCPLCGTKCSRVSDHDDKHDCAHHVLPAFRGLRYLGTDSPVLKTCSSLGEASFISFRRHSGALSTSDDCLFNCYNCPKWSNSVLRLADPTTKKKHVPVEQIEAWIYCKEPLLAYWNMVDETPDDWRAFARSSSLPQSAIGCALERLKAFQDIPL